MEEGVKRGAKEGKSKWMGKSEGRLTIVVRTLLEGACTLPPSLLLITILILIMIVITFSINIIIIQRILTIIFIFIIVLKIAPLSKWC